MKILVVVDMQNDFISGSLGTPEAKAIVPNVKKKIEEAVSNGDMIYYTRDTHFEDYLDTKEGEKLPVEHCAYKSEGWCIPDELMVPKTYENARIHDKFTFCAEALPAIMDQNQYTASCDEIELVGLCTDICVISNALLLKATVPETPICVNASCCAGVTPQSHKNALEAMKMCQIIIKE